MGKENFHEGSAGFSSTIKKNNEKINMKKFFQLEVRTVQNKYSFTTNKSSDSAPFQSLKSTASFVLQ